MKAEENRSEFWRAMDRLHRYLSVRDHSIFELRQKLSRSFSPEIIDQVLNEAEANGWLPKEEQVAESSVRILSRRLKSKRYIEGALRKKRLPIPKWEDGQEIQKIQELLSKKFGSVKNLTVEQKAKIFRFLSYRGFDPRSIREALKILAE